MAKPEIVNLRIELPESEHRALKLLVAQRRSNLQELLHRLVREELAAAKDLPVAPSEK